jgi:hypothetical protein
MRVEAEAQRTGCVSPGCLFIRNCTIVKVFRALPQRRISLIAAVVFLLLTACSQRTYGPKRLNKGAYDTARRAVDALEIANEYSTRSAGFYEPQVSHLKSGDCRLQPVEFVREFPEPFIASARHCWRKDHRK